MKTWRRWSSPAVWAVALVIGAPALVQAQTQLFPLAPIQRERVPCPMEDPVYGLYRHQYYGYFPTCWRPFPQGWGCPSPEAPNQARAFQDRPRDKPPESLPALDDGRGPAPIPGEDPEVPPQRGRNPLPPLPGGERNPFEIDAPTNPAAPGNRMPVPDAPGDAGAAGVDDRATPPAIAPAASTTAPAAEAAPVVEAEKGGLDANGLLTLPDPSESFSAPSQAPATTLPGASPTATSPENLGNPLGPLGPPTVSTSPALLGSASARPVVNPSLSPPPIAVGPPNLGPPSMPVQAPQRRGPIGTLFNGLTSRLRR